MNRNHMLALKRALDLLAENRHKEAEGIGLRILELDDQNPDAWFVSALSAHLQGNNAQALARFDRALELNPTIADFWVHRAAVYFHLGQMAAAERDYQQALHIDPVNLDALSNLARLLAQNNRAGEAEVFFRQAIQLSPRDAKLLGDLGVTLVAQRRVTEGVDFYRRGLHLDPQDPEIHFNLSRALLLLGQYGEGFRENEWRWQAKHYQSVARDLPFPLWDGSQLQGKKILLIQEQGFGDAILLVRYVPWVQQCGGEVFIQCRAGLVRLFNAMPSVRLAVSFAESLPAVDLCLPMFSLPRLFNTQLQTIPRQFPYLPIPEETGCPLLKSAKNAIRVGLVWAGTSQQGLSFSALRPILLVPNTAFFSIQLGPKRDEMHDIAGVSLQDMGSYLTDFAVTAALIQQLDLVISVDTALAHLAGAIHQSLWVLLHYRADWRWLGKDQKAPWYPDAQVFWQKSPGEWDDTIADVARELAVFVNKRQTG